MEINAVMLFPTRGASIYGQDLCICLFKSKQHPFFFFFGCAVYIHTKQQWHYYKLHNKITIHIQRTQQESDWYRIGLTHTSVSADVSCHRFDLMRRHACADWVKQRLIVADGRWHRDSYTVFCWIRPCLETVGVIHRRFLIWPDSCKKIKCSLH